MTSLLPAMPSQVTNVLSIQRMPPVVLSNSWAWSLPQATNADQPGYVVCWTNSNGAITSTWNFPVPYSIYRAKGWDSFVTTTMPAGQQSIGVYCISPNGYETNILQTNWVSPVIYPVQVTVNATGFDTPLTLWSGSTPSTANTNGTFVAGFITGVQTFQFTNNAQAMFYGVSTN